MKIYTVKNKDGKLLPYIFLKIPNVAECVVDGQIVNVDYGKQTVEDYLQTMAGLDYELAICELKEL